MSSTWQARGAVAGAGSDRTIVHTAVGTGTGTALIELLATDTRMLLRGGPPDALY